MLENQKKANVEIKDIFT